MNRMYDIYNTKTGDFLGLVVADNIEHAKSGNVVFTLQGKVVGVFVREYITYKEYTYGYAGH